MSTVTTKDGTEIYYKDWGPKDAQPIVFHHGWPLSADDWDTQMLFFVGHGYRTGGIPIEVFDGLRKSLADNRAQFYIDFSSGPFYGFNRAGAKAIPGVIQNWWRQGMMGSAKAHYDGIKAFSETNFTDDLKVIDVPTLVMHGTDDQIVPIADSAPLSAKLLKNGTLKIYEGFPHGMCTTHADVVNADLLTFIRS